MNFQIDKNRLLETLQRVGRATASYREASGLNAWYLREFFFKAELDCLTVAATDTYVFMEETVSIGHTDGINKTFAVEATPLLKAIKSLDNQSLELEVLEYQVIVRHSVGSFALPLSESVEIYKATPRPDIKFNTAHQIEMEAPGLLSLLNRCAYAVAQDELRPVMNGVCISLTKEYTDFAASDGHKLVRIRKKSITIDTPATLVIPRKVTEILRKILPATGFVELCFNEYIVDWPEDSKEPRPAAACRIIVDDNTVITFRPIEGRYPNYNSVIPTKFYKGFTIGRVAFVKSLERLSQFTSSSGLITFTIESGTIRMEAEDKDFSVSATEVLPCSYYGKKFRIGFKDSSLIQTLKNINSLEVEFQAVDASRATTFSPVTQPDSEEVTMLLMPMIIGD